MTKNTESRPVEKPRNRRKLPRSDPVSCDPHDPRQMALPFTPYGPDGPVKLPSGVRTTPTSGKEVI